MGYLNSRLNRVGNGYSSSSRDPKAGAVKVLRRCTRRRLPSVLGSARRSEA